MERIALFPGSFDPFTLGHQAVATRALTIFDRLVIGVGENTDKRGLLEPEARKGLILKTFEAEPRVDVVLYDGLTGDYCLRNGIFHIVRGIRNVADFEYEHAMEMANTQIYPSITTVAVFTPAQYIPVSSRLVREILTMGGDASAFLPSNIDISNYL